MERINFIGDIYKKGDTAKRFYEVVGREVEDSEQCEADIFLNSLIPEDLTNKITLDLGCGNSRYAEIMCKRGAKKVVGIDLNEEMLQQSDERKREKDLNQLDLVCADIDNLPLNKGEFDFIFSRFSLVHAAKLEKVMKDLSESLKSGGEVLIGTNIAVIEDLDNNSDLRRQPIPIIISINGNNVYLEDFSYTLEDYLDSFNQAELKVIIEKQFPTDDVLIDPNFPKKDLIRFNYGIFKLRKRDQMNIYGDEK